jgi:hypothetical protein
MPRMANTILVGQAGACAHQPLVHAVSRSSMFASRGRSIAAPDGRPDALGEIAQRCVMSRSLFREPPDTHSRAKPDNGFGRSVIVG